MPRPHIPYPIVDVPQNSSTTAALSVGSRYSGRFDATGDSDWVAIDLVAGETYSFNLGPGAANAGSPFDTTLGIYSASGTLVAFNDDVGFTAISNPGVGGIANPYNFYSFIEFTPTTSGTYYVAASSLDSNTVGDYVLSAFAGDLPYAFDTPATLEVGGASLTSRLDFSGDIDSLMVDTVAGEYYTVSITQSGDFTQLLIPYVQASDADGAVIANNIGFLTTQFTFKATAETTWLDVASLYTGFDVGQYSIHVEEASLVDAVEHPNWTPLPASTRVYFSENATVTNAYGETYTTTAVTAAERTATLKAFKAWADVANIAFTVVDDPADADLFVAFRDDVGLLNAAGQSVIPPDDITINGVTYSNKVGLDVFRGRQLPGDEAYDPGSYGFTTLVHELGHLMGLSHAMSDSGPSAGIPGTPPAFPGVFDVPGLEIGDFGLHQGAYSIMGYKAGLFEKDGFINAYEGYVEFGLAASPMAIDIAAVQQIYGANTSTRTGNDTYVLPELNGPGPGYVCIWDNGGVDAITAAAANTGGVTIDLRAATLDYELNGGGAISWAHGVAGGFTIAKGVVIENATGAAGDDRLVGNDAANRLEGRAGNDELGGSAGNDRLLGGHGNDRLFGDALLGRPSGIGFGSGLVVSGSGANNNSFGTAVDITNAFTLAIDSDVAQSQTVPHVTIAGTGDGSVDYYKITLAKGATVKFDMDHTTGGLNGSVIIFDASGTQLTWLLSGRPSEGAGGSISFDDPDGDFTAWDGGTYYFMVAQQKPEGPSVMAAGQNYQLQVSVPAETEKVGSGAGNDYLDGGAGDDLLVGGAGSDTLDGGTGVDTASYVDAARAVRVSLSESGQQDTGGAGRDRLINIENLVGSDFDDRLTGNRGNNSLDGGNGNDRLSGGRGNDYLDGGIGNDRLEGGTGDDTFYFGDRLGSGNVDAICDFDRHDDQILLDQEVFFGLSAGALQLEAFKVLRGGASVDADDRIVYDARTGNLYFDQDGSLSGFDAVRFAIIENNTRLSASDFLII